MSDDGTKLEQPCVRCGVLVNAPVTDTGKVYCVDCRQHLKAESVAKSSTSVKDPVSLSNDDTLTVTCQLCQSSLLVNEAKIGTRITCPDCHSTIVVQRPKPRRRRQTGRPQPPKTPAAKKRFDPDAELSLEQAAEHPEMDPSIGFDQVTEDLLSAPLPEVETPELNSLDAHTSPQSDDDVDVDDTPSADQQLTRRQRYQRMQKRIISDDRKEKRKQWRAKQAAKKNQVTRAVPLEEANATSPPARKPRRKRKGRRNQVADPGGWVKPAFGWLRQRWSVIGWIVATSCLSVAYAAEVDWSPVAWLDRWYVMLVQSPVVLDYRLIVNSILFIVGSIFLYRLCGRAFAMNAGANLSSSPKSESSAESSNVSGIFSTLHFAMAWLLVGLPFLYWSILVIPIQLLIVPPLLVGSWLNGSVWKFVRSDGLIAADERETTRELWFKLYRLTAVAAAVTCVPALMIHSGGALAVGGCLLITVIMIGMAGVFGGHCRELSKSLETSP